MNFVFSIVMVYCYLKSVLALIYFLHEEPSKSSLIIIQMIFKDMIFPNVCIVGTPICPLHTPPPPKKNANYHLYVKTEKSHNFNQEMNLWSQNLLNSSTLLKLVKLGQT